MFLVLLTGCWPTASRYASKTSLDFLEDGKTTKEAVILKLGPPTGTFEGEKIISYRLGKTQEGYFVTDRLTYPYKQEIPLWLRDTEGLFSLVLVFDENQILQKHSLVRAK